MKFEGNHVVTNNKEIEKGKEYQYYESLPLCICNVIVEDMHNDENGYGFKVKVTKPLTANVKPDDVFEISAAHGNGAYSGMWRLYDKDTYTNRTYQ